MTRTVNSLTIVGSSSLPAAEEGSAPAPLPHLTVSSSISYKGIRKKSTTMTSVAVRSSHAVALVGTGGDGELMRTGLRPPQAHRKAIVQGVKRALVDKGSQLVPAGSDDSGAARCVFGVPRGCDKIKTFLRRLAPKRISEPPPPHSPPFHGARGECSRSLCDVSALR